MSRHTWTNWSAPSPGSEAAVVGFSSTFQQNAASFALARRLKQRHPHIVTVFGGANFDDEMGPELVRAVDCIDVAVIGEGDETFPRLLDALAAGTDLDAVPGLARRLDGQVTVTPPVPAPSGQTICQRRIMMNIFSTRRTWASCPASGTATSGFPSRPPAGAGGAQSITARSAG